MAIKCAEIKLALIHLQIFCGRFQTVAHRTVLPSKVADIGRYLTMNTYKRHRFPPDIISYAVWLYYRFSLSHRDIEDLLAERGVTVSREAIRLWCIKFGTLYARRLKRKHGGYGDTFYIDEVFVKINGKQHYLWQAGSRPRR